MLLLARNKYPTLVGKSALPSVTRRPSHFFSCDYVKTSQKSRSRNLNGIGCHGHSPRTGATRRTFQQRE